jgi:hypothetical protein
MIFNDHLSGPSVAFAVRRRLCQARAHATAAGYSHATAEIIKLIASRRPKTGSIDGVAERRTYPAWIISVRRDCQRGSLNIDRSSIADSITSALLVGSLPRKLGYFESGNLCKSFKIWSGRRDSNPRD